MDQTWLMRRVLRLYKDNPGYAYTLLQLKAELKVEDRDLKTFKTEIFAMREAGILKKDGRSHYRLGDTTKVTPKPARRTITGPAELTPLQRDIIAVVHNAVDANIALMEMVRDAATPRPIYPKGTYESGIVGERGPEVIREGVHDWSFQFKPLPPTVHEFFGLQPLHRKPAE